LLRWLPFLAADAINVVTSSAHDLLPFGTKVTVISYDLVRLYEDKFDRIQQSDSAFGVVICDESHYLKSPTAARTVAVLKLLQGSRRVIMLSGTPALSRPIEIYTQVNAILPGFFGSYETFGYQYCAGTAGRFGMEYKGAEMLVQLHLLLKKFVMIRRLKVDVLTELRPKTRTAVMLDPPQRAELESGASQQHFEALRPLLLKIVAASDADADSGGSSNSSGGSSAPKKPAKKGANGAGNGSSGHLEAFARTSEAKIPVVTQYISQLLKSGGDKFLVFAHHVTMLDAIEQCVVEANSGYMRIDGSTQSFERQERVVQFQQDPHTRVAILSLTAASTGLTLTAANKVVFAELYWTPALLLQAEDRVHRIGQTREVFVVYLLARGTVDDVIWPLIAEKLDVVGNTLNGAVSTMDFRTVRGALSRS
jgi:SWI/SNF-related matrix-associated actin-dependent regulator 1 of chromatin subfamily A